jgi:membrane protein YqaA with SNARE-associated domain
MNLTEMYLLLFTDTLVTNLAINTSSELVINSMKIFNSYNPYAIILVSTTSFALASSINYLLGIICHKVLSPLTNEDIVSSQSKIEQIRRSRYLLLFLALSAVPFFGKFVLVFAGFCRINLSLTIAIVIFSKLVYYSYFMLYQAV